MFGDSLFYGKMRAINMGRGTKHDYVILMFFEPCSFKAQFYGEIEHLKWEQGPKYIQKEVLEKEKEKRKPLKKGATYPLSYNHVWYPVPMFYCSIFYRTGLETLL